MKKVKIERILVAVKPWDTGVPGAAEHARILAQALGAEVLLASTVFDSDVAFRVDRGDAGALAAQRGLIAAEERALEGLAQSVRDWGVPARARVLWHRVVHEAILEELERSNAELLVVGAHEPELRPHTRLTETDWQLMRLCPVPLLLAKNPEPAEYTRILAAVDPLHAHEEPAGLDQSVLELAAALHAAFGAEVYAANAYPDPESFALASSVQVLPGVFYGTENIESLHREAAEELVTAYGIAPGRLELRPGNPVDVIADVVADRHVDLVVVGALKRSRLEQALLGSTAEGLAHAVDCDVLFVKPRG